jgi:hypothetical protein
MPLACWFWRLANELSFADGFHDQRANNICGFLLRTGMPASHRHRQASGLCSPELLASIQVGG